MIEKLKPCPFCGGKAKLVDNRLEWYVKCTGCQVVVIGDRATEEDTTRDFDWDAIKQTAVDRWNARAD